MQQYLPSSSKYLPTYLRLCLAKCTYIYSRAKEIYYAVGTNLGLLSEGQPRPPRSVWWRGE